MVTANIQRTLFPFIKGVPMNAPINPDRISILAAARDIRLSWSREERDRRARAARRYAQFLSTLIADAQESDKIWAVGAPSAADLGRLAVAR